MKFFEENEEIKMVTISRSYEISPELNIYQVADYATEMGVDLLPDLTETSLIDKIVDLTVELEPIDNILSLTIYFMADENYNPIPEALETMNAFMENLESDIEENLSEKEDQ